MKITDFLSPQRVIPALQGKDKAAILKEIADWIAAEDSSLRAEKVLGVLLERERISTTAIGEGVAIPHGKLSGVAQISGLFARSLAGVDFASLDGGLTYLFFVLIAPENSAADHLKALARISRLLKDPEFRNRLMKGTSSEEIFDIIRTEDDKF